MACSRMPKCSVRPYQAPGNIAVCAVRREERRLALHRGVVAPGQVGRAAPQLGQHRRRARSAPRPEAVRVASPLASGGNVGSALGPAVRQPARGQPVQQRGALRAGRRPGAERCVPLGVQPACRGRRPGGRARRPRPRPGRTRSGSKPRISLGRGHLVGAERGAVRRAGVLRVRRGPGDDRAQRDQRRLRRSRPGPSAAPRTAPATSSW